MGQPAAQAGVLYLVPTPIGNLGDMTQRALTVLGQVALVAAEDTRHSGRLLQHFGIQTRLTPFHDHSDTAALNKILAALARGEDVALVSDAGTPLIADPGYGLVRAARAQGCQVVPLPGPCALITALSASGLPTDRFTFVGFLPAKGAAKRARIAALAGADCTTILYEAPHRLRDTLAELELAVGPERELVVARELTKTFETFLTGSCQAVAARVAQDPDQVRGEVVVLIAPAPPQGSEDDARAQELVAALMEEGMGVAAACRVAAKFTGAKRNPLYQWALARQPEAGGEPS